MSRGNRVASSGNISTSMRDNYNQHGVGKYYKKVGATYRNPHYPGVRQCLFAWFTSWWQQEHANIDARGPTIFDMACGSGEVIIALQEWWLSGLSTNNQSIPTEIMQRAVPLPRSKPRILVPPLDSHTPTPLVIAADPYTSEAFKARTSLPCAALSFSDIAQGVMPASTSPLPLSAPAQAATAKSEDAISPREILPNLVEMVICSFALHLIDTPSELFALLWELSTKCRWLVILAPHKKPQIKDGWGWSKWDTEKWSNCSMAEVQGEFLFDRVHCRVYRSLNVH